RPPQRIGLSATQRPLDEVARFLGGADRTDAKPRRRELATHEREQAEASLDDEFASPGRSVSYRPVAIVDAGAKKELKLRIEMPVEALASRPRVARERSRRRAGSPQAFHEHQSEAAHSTQSIWSAIHPRLLELIRARRST